MNTQKGFVGGLLLAIIVVGLAIWAGSYYFSKQSNEKVPDNSPAYLAPSTDEKYGWGFTDGGTDKDGISHTKVSLNIDGKVYTVGTYQGSCNEVKAGEKGVTGESADANENSRVQCWFAGGGNEIGIFSEDKNTVVKEGELGEEDAETPPFRGNFKTLFSITTVTKTGNNTPKEEVEGPLTRIICTMEAKQCPDGSYVGRTGPNCEFAACK